MRSAMRRIGSAVLLSVLGAACGDGGGSGSIVVVNRHPVCTLFVELDGEAVREVRPRRTLTVKDVPARGHELVFTAEPNDCVVYTRYSDTPLESGRNLCNTFVDDAHESRFTAVKVERPGYQQVTVLCPDQ
ncbi:MAG: hypothetical protein HY904_16605 [Deltaproteobacteria bacterium]|nr:hypothetical protein [Deltaproteobacteria bacterium]